jgi:hypothetical protein
VLGQYVGALLGCGGSGSIALHAVLCTTGYNLRWMMRAMARLGLQAIYLCQFLLALQAAFSEKDSHTHVYYGSTFTFPSL